MAVVAKHTELSLEMIYSLCVIHFKFLSVCKQVSLFASVSSFFVITGS